MLPLRTMLLPALSLLALACSLPLGSPTADLTFTLVPPQGSTSRLVAGETAWVRVDISTFGRDDARKYFQVTVDNNGVRKATVKVQTTPGQHGVTVAALDADGEVLTQAVTQRRFEAGANHLSLTMTPPLQLGNGSAPSLGPNQVRYYTIPGALASLVELTGTETTFWPCAADGSYSGAGSPGALAVDVSDGQDRYVRVRQASAGSFSAVVRLSVLTLSWDFTYPEAPLLSLPVVPILNGDAAQTLVCDPKLELTPTLYGLKWTIDGLESYPDAAPFSVTDFVLTVETAHLATGTHELVLSVTDGVHVYSSSVGFTVGRTTP